MRTPLILLAASLATWTPAALAHDPPQPNPVCTPSQAMHEVLASSLLLAESGAAGRRGFGNGNVYDMSQDCQGAPLCLVGTCTPGPVAATDGDFETGVGYAYLPASHHDATIDVAFSLGAEAQILVGTDGNGDGVLDGRDPADCLEYFRLSGDGSVTTSCVPAAGEGWFVHTTCTAAAGDDARLWTGGDPVERRPTPHVNPAWQPDPAPPTAADPGASCYFAGHVG